LKEVLNTINLTPLNTVTQCMTFHQNYLPLLNIKALQIHINLRYHIFITAFPSSQTTVTTNFPIFINIHYYKGIIYFPFSIIFTLLLICNSLIPIALISIPFSFPYTFNIFPSLQTPVNVYIQLPHLNKFCLKFQRIFISSRSAVTIYS
jgi:hypothetical protein